MTPKFGHDSAVSGHSHRSAVADKSSRQGGDDLDDLIDDISGKDGTTGSVGSFKYQAPITINSHPTSQQLGGKCYPLFIGGQQLQEGITATSVKPFSCSTLMCYNCDKKVHRFPGKRWKHTVDYIFVRNHNTNIKELVKVRKRYF